ncbi:hypothetical protein Pint_17581 [Pistacia integerrima]|uniref:Uncharacterized protein n=1 Tax=Pistacia integerrima TaxID=434235 RepID=A0ACC0Z1P9_9ROSI|nr:hypothetical protein Pint_17581 [Pistacia integerrima]
MAPSSLCSSWLLLVFLVMATGFSCCTASQIGLGSRLLASEDQTWISENRTFAFGFTPVPNNRDRFQLAIWFAELPGDRTVTQSWIWTPPEILFFSTGKPPYGVQTPQAPGIEYAVMSESGNFILYTTNNRSAWQSFWHPSDTLLPNQPLGVSLELTSPKSPSHGGYYSLKMLQQPTSLSLALTYNLPESYDASPEAYANISYWSSPEISNVTGDVVAVLDEAGSFGIVYGDTSSGAIYVYKNDGDTGGLSSATNQSTRLSVLRRLILETNGNIRLYRWDNDVNGSRQWVPEWAAVSNPCDIAGICGNGICKLDRSKTNASCTCLPGTSKGGSDGQCSESSSSIGKCDSRRENQTSQYKTAAVALTNYYFSDYSVITNYSDIDTVSKCGDACLSDCECVASLYGLDDEKPYCWVLRGLDFGGYEDPGSTLFVKIGANGSTAPGGSDDSSEGSGSVRQKILAIPIVLSMTVLIGLLCLLLYYNVHRKRALKKAMENSLIETGAPLNFTYRDLQIRTSNFSQLLGTDGRLEGTVDEEEVTRALKVAFWCIQDEVFMRPSMGEVVKMLEGSIDINTPPMPQTVLELIEEGLDHVYRAMKRDFNQFSSVTINSLPSSHTHSHATCSYSTMSPR